MSKSKLPIIAGAAALGIGLVVFASSSSAASTTSGKKLPPNVLVIPASSDPNDQVQVVEKLASGAYTGAVLSSSRGDENDSAELDAIIGYAKNYGDLLFVYFTGSPPEISDAISAMGLRVASQEAEEFTTGDTTLEAFEIHVELAINFAKGGSTDVVDEDDQVVDTSPPDPGNGGGGGGYITGVPPGNPPGFSNQAVLDAIFQDATGLARSLKYMGYDVPNVAALAQLLIDSYKFKAEDDIPVPIVKQFQRGYNTLSRARGLKAGSVTIPSNLGGLNVDGFFGYKTQAAVIAVVDLIAPPNRQQVIDYISQREDTWPSGEVFVDVVSSLRAQGVP